MRIHGWLVTAGLLASAASASASAKSRDEDAVLNAEGQFSAAVAANNVKAVSTATAEDWQIIDGGGHVIPRATFLQIIASGTLKHTSLSNSDQSVRIYGDAAIVTAHSKSAGTYGGNGFSTDEISTDFWIRKKGRWQCILTQLTTRKS